MKGGRGWTSWQKKVWGDGSGEFVPPNLGGERVVRTAKAKPQGKSAAASVRPRGGEGSEEGFSVRRALIVGVLAQPAFFFGAQQLSSPQSFGSLGDGGKRAKLVEEADSYYDGDAVTAPELETTLLELLEERAPGVERDATAAKLVATLEERGGTQIFASAGQGRWVLPWVGGWERKWTNVADASYLGGPKETSFSKRGIALDQVSARHFVYGPGEGGITIEYLYAYQGDLNAPIKFLLTRPGSVTNLGDNVFQLDFPKVLDEYEVFYDRTKGADRLANCVPTLNANGNPTGLLECSPIESGAERGAPASTLLIKTTYLSEKLWIQRDARDESKVARTALPAPRPSLLTAPRATWQVTVFTRTATRSVMDRRGLVADGQLKPSDDEATRYGALLFGETIQDYSVRPRPSPPGVASPCRLPAASACRK